MKILLIDDQKNLILEPFEELAELLDNVEIKYFQYSSDAFDFLEKSYHEVSGVVLDARGFRDPDSEKAVDAHLHEAIGKLDEYNAEGKGLPYVVYTGHFETISDQLVHRKEIKIFEKGMHSPREVLEYLKGEIESHPNSQLKKQYPTVFELAAKYFDNESIDLLNNLLLRESLNSNLYVYKKENFESLRTLNEALVDTLPKHFFEESYELDEFIKLINRKNDRLNANLGNRSKKIIDYFFYGKIEKVPRHVRNNIHDIYDLASSHFSHHSEKSDCPDNLQFDALLKGHLSNYSWFSQIIN